MCLKKLYVVGNFLHLTYLKFHDSVWMRENADQKNSEYGHFLRSVYIFLFIFFSFLLFETFFTVDLHIVKN